VTLTAGERVAASIVAFLVAAMTVAYAIDRLGFTIAPAFVLIAAVAAALGPLVARQTETPDRAESIAFAAIVGATFAYLLWLARPSLLPVGSGPDLTHHLILVDYIERHWRLVHDPALGAVMGEMVDYTPGFHLLAVLAGAWTGTDGFHAAYPVLALTVALKAGVVFLIAMRLLRRSGNAPPQILVAVAAALMLFVPREYFLRSFTEHAFLAQVVSELFAVAMWWALVVWDERPSRAAMTYFAIAGIGAFLTWPVWIGPLLLALAVTVAVRDGLPVRERLASLAVAGTPIAVVAAVHAAGRLQAVGIARTAGFVVWPSIEMFTWWFLVLAGAGLILAMMNRGTRSIVWLVGAIALQAGALFVVAARNGADRPYLALKMVYLAVYPLAVASASALAVVGRAWQARLDGGPKRALQKTLASGAALVLAVVVGRGLITEPRHQPVVSTPMYLAGRWARTNLNAACIDYLVQDDDSAYWLHLAVLGNARHSDRARDPMTFEPKQALIRWIQPEGLPFAITDDFGALPKDIRTTVDVVQRFGPAAVVKRRGRSTCASH
jgi:hypothetical protein